MNKELDSELDHDYELDDDVTEEEFEATSKKSEDPRHEAEVNLDELEVAAREDADQEVEEDDEETEGFVANPAPATPEEVESE